MSIQLRCSTRTGRFLLNAIPVAIFLLMALLPPMTARMAGAATTPFPGGFVEKTNSGSVRSLLSASQIQSLVPQRGVFTFPPPYGTQGVRITNASDCGGTDCVDAVGYSYWNNMNNSTGSDTMLMVIGLDRSRGGRGPTLYSYNKVTDEVKVLGALFDAASPYSYGSGEGWYFSGTKPTAFYLNWDSKLLRYDVISKQMETVFDAATQYGSDKYIWQIHSSNDDRVHSATLRSKSNYEMLGCLAYREDTRQYFYYPKKGDFDECQIDKSGRWLLIKENVDGLYGEDNRVIDLNNGTEQVLLDQNGAAGHSDNGYGYMVYSDNWNNLPGAIRVFTFGTDQMKAPLVSNNTNWGISSPAHVSHGNSKSGAALEQQIACGSSANTTNGTRANEIICFRLDTSMDVLVVAPVMTDLSASGGGSDTYYKMPKGNIDPTGQYFIWTSNMSGARQDAFIVKVPSQLLGSGGSSTPPPADTTAPVLTSIGSSQVTSIGALVSWTSGETSTSQVDYGTTTAYGSSSALDGSLVYSHTRQLSGLLAGTVYHYRVRSRDAAGNLATSGDFAFTTGAAAAPPSTGPIGYWALDEASGSTAMDSSGNGENGTLLNGPVRVAGRIGSALAFNGANDAVDIPHAPILNAYPLTVSLWTRTTATGLSGLVNKYVAASMNGYQVFTSGGNLCAWYFRDNANYVWDGSGCTLATPGFNDGLWHHVVFLVDASGGRLIVDGQARASRGWTGTPGATATTQPISLARYPNTTLPSLTGQLDDVRIYNRALASTEVASLFGGAAGGTGGTSDTTPPAVSAVAAASLTSTGATIKWTTNEAGDTQVDYGTTTAYGTLTAANSTPTKAHSQVLSGLAAGTLYHFRVRTRDAAGNLAVSGDSHFTTSAVRTTPVVGGDTTAPLITQVSFAAVLSQVVISWRTSEPSDTQVEYGTTTSYGSLSPKGASLVGAHMLALGGLVPATTYHARLYSRDAAGNLAVSADFTFRTR